MWNRILVVTIGSLIAAAIISGASYGVYVQRCLARNEVEIEQLKKAVVSLAKVPATLQRIDMRTRVIAEKLGVDVDKIEGN